MNLPTADLTISRSEAEKLIRNARGMVSVYAVKRSDGSLRRFNGFAACNLSPEERSRVTSGKGMSFDPLAHDLIPFYDMVSEIGDGFRTVKGKVIPGKVRRTVGKQFRNVAVEGIRVIRTGRVTYHV